MATADGVNIKRCALLSRSPKKIADRCYSSSKTSMVIIGGLPC